MRLFIILMIGIYYFFSINFSKEAQEESIEEDNKVAQIYVDYYKKYFKEAWTKHPYKDLIANYKISYTRYGNRHSEPFVSVEVTWNEKLVGPHKDTYLPRGEREAGGYGRRNIERAILLGLCSNADEPSTNLTGSYIPDLWIGISAFDPLNRGANCSIQSGSAGRFSDNFKELLKDEFGINVNIGQRPSGFALHYTRNN